MTLAYANLPAQAATKAVAITGLTVANLKHVSTTSTNGGKTQISVYVYVGSDPASNTTVTVRRELTKDGMRNSIRLQTTVSYPSVLDADVTVYEPYEAVIAWNHPGANFSDLAKQSAFLQCAFALLFSAYDGTTGVPTATPLSNINYGLTQSIWS